MSVEREVGAPDGHAVPTAAPVGVAHGFELQPSGGDLVPVEGVRDTRRQTPPRAQARSVSRPGKRAQAQGARILVVDDEEVVRMLVVDLLRERGHMVREAEDGDGAMLQLRSSDALDLMITDIGLPNDFDGSTLARRARVLRPGLPILFITGYAFGTRGITLEPGIPVLTKPFTLSALSERIAVLLGGAGG